MWPTLLLGLLVASLAGWGITAYLQTSANSQTGALA